MLRRGEQPMAQAKVIQVARRPHDGQVSIERVFDSLEGGLQKDWDLERVVLPLRSSGLIARLQSLWFVYRLRADVIHIVGDIHYVALALVGRRVVLTIHDCAVLHRLRGWRRLIVKYLWFKWPVRIATHVTAISEATRSDLNFWIGPLADQVEVIPNPVPGQFKATPMREMGSSAVVLQMGTKWNKNLRRVATAVAQVGASLLIVGKLNSADHGFLESLQITYEALGVIDDDEVPHVYELSDIVVFASLFEGFGLPVLEAQAAGRPLIASRISPICDIAGAGAILVDPSDTQELTDALQFVIGSSAERERLVRAGAHNVALFSEDSVTVRYSQVYRCTLDSTE